MKNLFTLLAFMLVGTFAFASTGDVEILNDNVIVKEIIETPETSEEEKEAAERMSCFDFTDSCGGSWEVCHEGVSTAQLIDFLWNWDGGC